MKRLKTTFHIILAVLSFGFTPSFDNVKANDNYADLMSAVKNSFESSGMNFQKDFQKDFEGMIKDKMSFNLGVLVGGKHAPGVGAAHHMGGHSIPQELIRSSVGDFSFTITRNTSKVVIGGAPQTLPYVLFGLNDSNSGYASTLNGFIPAGVLQGDGGFAAAPYGAGTLPKVFQYVNGDGVFAYNDGAHADSITIKYIGVNNYASFLNSNNTNLFESKYTLQTIISTGANSLADEQAQFFQTVTYGDLSSLGKKDQNTLNPNSRITTTQFQSNRADLITPVYKIDSVYSWLQAIVPCSTAANSVMIGQDTFISWRGQMGDGRKGEIVGRA